MFTFDISDKLRKKLEKLGKKDPVLAKIFKKKLKEIISQDKETINTYKNLKSPLNQYKRIHLTDNFILLFVVEQDESNIVFIDILHWDHAYSS